MKFKAKTKDCRLIVKVRVGLNENIVDADLDRFSRIGLRGFLKPNVKKKKIIEYVGPVGISLYERLQRPISKRDVFFILEHIVVSVQKLRANDLSLKYLICDFENVYINEVTKEVQFLYVPVQCNRIAANINDLIESIIYSVIPENGKDTEYLSRFATFFNSLKDFDSEKIEKYILHEDKSVVKSIKKHQGGQSGFMTNKRKSYYDYYDQKEQKLQDASLGEDKDTDLMDEDECTGLMDEDEATGLMNEEEGTDLMDEDEATGLMNEDEDTGLMDEDEGNFNMDECEETDYMDEVSEDNIDNDENLTMPLDDTSLLKEEELVSFAYLIRVRTNERIEINKPVFRVGKERSYVDYFVTNNNAVSRSHADIIMRGKSFFIKDLNSKNHTFINGQILPSSFEIEIHAGDTLKLGNEEFLFFI